MNLSLGRVIKPEALSSADSVAALRNLADMWEQDPRFAINYERIREGGAAFVRKAVHIYCDKHA